MTAKTKILIGILILIIIAGTGIVWFIWKWQGYVMRIVEVSIYTDKTKYEIGETVKITVKNNSNKSIWYYEFDGFRCTSSFSMGIKKEDSEKFFPLGLANCISSPQELKPNSEQAFKLELKRNEEDLNFSKWLQMYDLKLPAIYKLKFNYGTEKKTLDEKIAYSNKFTIKEKVEDETANWKTYRNEEIKKIGEEISCEWSRHPDNCYDFLNSLFNNPVDSRIVGSDKRLREYFENNLDHISFEGISRGKFDKYSEKEVVLVSLKLQSGKHFNSYIILFREKTKEKWQALYQNIGYFQKFFNEPRKLVKDEPKFFVGEATPMGGTCVPVSWSTLIYRLENNRFKSTWSSVYYIDGEIYDEEGRPIGQVEKMETDLEYRDLDGDGNLEIIKEGTRRLCKGHCYDCEELIKEEKIYQIFKWDAQEQTFVEKIVE